VRPCGAAAAGVPGRARGCRHTQQAVGSGAWPVGLEQVDCQAQAHSRHRNTQHPPSARYSSTRCHNGCGRRPARLHCVRHPSCAGRCARGAPSGLDTPSPQLPQLCPPPLLPQGMLKNKARMQQKPGGAQFSHRQVAGKTNTSGRRSAQSMHRQVRVGRAFEGRLPYCSHRTCGPQAPAPWTERSAAPLP